MQQNDKKIIRGWAFFDWANSSYNLVITSTIFPAYYAAITGDSSDAIGDYVTFLGRKFINTSLYSYALAAAFLIIAILSPILSSIADSRGSRKDFMRFFTILGAAACAMLFFFTADRVQFGIIMFAIAAIGFWGSLVFYNAYLPEIASTDKQDKVSAMGFAYGYVGSVILQLICFIFVFFPKVFGLADEGAASRLSFLLVAIWWLGFAQITFKVLPPNMPKAGAEKKNLFSAGFAELGAVWSMVKDKAVLKKYLAAYWLYSMGVQTVMLMATVFGEKILHLGTTKLIGTILALQLLAIPGAYLISKLSAVWGNIKVLMLLVVVWIGCCYAAYVITTEIQFYMLAGVVGIIMGGTQSLSRSTYAKLLPEKISDTTAYFSFFDVTEKVALIIGMFSFGYIEELSGSMRNSTLALALFFILGLVMLWLIRSDNYAFIAKKNSVN